MTKIIMTILVIFLSLLSCGCSSKSDVSPGTKHINMKTFKPSSANGVLYLVRKGDFVAGGVDDIYYIDGEYLVTLGNEDLVYYIVELPPKVYDVLHIQDKGLDKVKIGSRLKVRANRKYMYYICRGSARPIPFDEDAFKGGKLLGYKKIK